ncbi:uncharacterized protein LOC126790434 [Argentina anserina]|uniref:uncharacterized protein LOC126790434 n=1 Tax=Argentina anserina TaxID=57926 RepID=UPI0021765F25|nr:uncharacterized protein LOC126790434 [Potentilla anserina]
MAATDSNSQVDVRKLASFFESLSTSSPDTRNPLSFETRNQKGSRGSAGSGTYTPDDLSDKFRGSVAGGGTSMNKGPLRVPYNEDFKANSKQTRTLTPIGFPTFPSFEIGPAFVPDAPGYMVSGVYCDNCSKEHPTMYCPDIPCRVCYKVHHPFNCPYFRHLPRGATFAPGYEVLCVCGNVFSEAKWRCTFCAGSRAVLRAKFCSVCLSSGMHATYECPEDKVLAAEDKFIRDKWLAEGFELGRLCGYMKDG